MELEEQLNGWQHGQAFKVHWKDRLCQWDWCVCNIQHITFFFVADVDSQRALLDLYLFEPSQEHRDNHLYVPLSHTHMKVSRLSGEDAYIIDRQGSMNDPAVQGPTSLPI